MEQEHKSVLEKWLDEYSTHGPRFTYCTLPITQQPNSDDFSCSLLAWNALAHFFLPQQYPLIDAFELTSERLKLLLRICNHQQEEGFVASNKDYSYFATSEILEDESANNTEPASDTESHSDMCTSSSDESSTVDNMSMITPTPTSNGKAKIQLESST